MHGLRACKGGDMPPPDVGGLLGAKDTHRVHVAPVHVAAKGHLLQHARPAQNTPAPFHPRNTPDP
eukprot:1601640-Prorocentrum_lima.AAC.1